MSNKFAFYIPYPSAGVTSESVGTSPLNKQDFLKQVLDDTNVVNHGLTPAKRLNKQFHLLKNGDPVYKKLGGSMHVIRQLKALCRLINYSSSRLVPSLCTDSSQLCVFFHCPCALLVHLHAGNIQTPGPPVVAFFISSTWNQSSEDLRPNHCRPFLLPYKALRPLLASITPCSHW